MKQFIALCIICISLPCVSQSNLDSLCSIWNDESIADTSRLKSLSELFDGLIIEKSDSALQIAKIQYDFAEKRGNKTEATA